MNRLLLVDDNPMVLALLEKAIAPLGCVVTAVDGEKALRQLEAGPPDLIICDYQMPVMDGRQLLERLRARSPRIPMVLMASRADITERLKTVEDAVEVFLEKPFFVADATARIKRVLDKIALEKMARAAAPGQTVLSGSLEQMNVIDLMQSLELGRKTCALALTRDGERCELFFSEGQVQHAVYGPLTGDQAVYKVLAWMEPSGSFQIDFAARTAEQTTTLSTQGLLMEGLRLLDEANRDGAET